ncbi:MAG: type II toxin-antitoxin system HicA family toxin, partial [Thaumarchaeota archaeon]|nr:type II toxin-antitoxin system HicA family toxin [Nitrososphaerota archaeon]
MSLRNHNWREVIKILNKLEFVVKRQSGSHIIMEHPDGRWTVVPRHNPIKIGTLKEYRGRYRPDSGRVPK